MLFRSILSYCDRCPVTLVTWKEAMSYCKAKNRRLPTEAEWEWASLGGMKNPTFFELIEKNEIHFEKDFNSGTTEVDSSVPNEFGLYHMLGNAWEWINDWFAFYTIDKAFNVSTPSAGTRKIVRGGSWYSPLYYVNPRLRFRLYPKSKLNSLGFRCAADNI